MRPTRFYTEAAPAPQLAPVVACYWVFSVSADDDGSDHLIIPDGGVNVATVPGGAGEAFRVGVAGPRTEPIVIPIQRRFVYWGLRLWPGAAAALGLDPIATRNLHDQGDLGCAPIAAWCRAVRNSAQDGGMADDPGEGSAVFQAMDGALIGAEVRANRLDQTVMAVVFEILRSEGREAIGTLAEAAGLSIRQLQRRFKAAVGLTPKELSRVRRMRAAAVRSVERRDEWSEVAASSGYADQAHMIREFCRLYGLPPEGFRRAEERIRLGNYS